MIITSNRFFPEFWQYHKKDGELMLLLKSLDGKRSLNHSGTFNIINCAPNRKDEKLFRTKIICLNVLRIYINTNYSIFLFCV